MSCFVFKNFVVCCFSEPNWLIYSNLSKRIQKKRGKEPSSLVLSLPAEEEEVVVQDDVVVHVDEQAATVGGGSTFRFLALGGSHCADEAAAKAA